MADKLLEMIQSPKDLKKLSFSELNDLAEEVRARIIEVLSVAGGHLASNLGIIELTIALHRVFNSPEDKLIFDTSHQTYPHKILTGRNDSFHTIRKYQGLSGFSNPKESSFDHFYAGHAGTALSLALGVSKKRDLQEESFHVLPIVGDAALTCGMVLEALNNLPKDLKRFIIILNDNAMAISNNVGAIKDILNRILRNPTLHKIYHDIENMVLKVPGCGPQLARGGQKVVDSLKSLVSPLAFFEQYGLSYVGPLNGHDIKKMVDVFSTLKDSDGPVLVHVQTVKGKGLSEAVLNPITHHGAKPFDPDTGKFIPNPVKKITFPKIFGKHLLEMAIEDPSIVAITPAMSFGSCLDDFMEKYPDRCIDVGIAESHSVTYSAGIAYEGKVKVVASIYSTFLQRAFDNIYHDVCLQEIPLVIAIDRAGLAGGNGSTHNGIYDIGFLNMMPHMIICQPRNGHVLKELLSSAFSWNRPTAIRYPDRATYEEDGVLKTRIVGKADVLQQGHDMLIIALGHMDQVALDISQKLGDYGVYPTIIDPVFIKPLDEELLLRLMQTHQQVVIIEENASLGGLGSIINDLVMRNHVEGVTTHCFGIPDVIVEQGSHKELLEEIGLTAEHISRQLIADLNLIKTCEMRV